MYKAISSFFFSYSISYKLYKKECFFTSYVEENMISIADNFIIWSRIKDFTNYDRVNSMLSSSQILLNRIEMRSSSDPLQRRRPRLNIASFSTTFLSTPTESFLNILIKIEF